jgi:hypothetical protein
MRNLIEYSDSVTGISSERFLRGSLSGRSGKCGKPNCHCAAGEAHPSLYLVQSRAGKSRQWCVPKALHDPVRHAVGEYQEIQCLLPYAVPIVSDEGVARSSATGR